MTSQCREDQKTTQLIERAKKKGEWFAIRPKRNRKAWTY